MDKFQEVIGIDPSITASAIADRYGFTLCGGDSKHGDSRLDMIYQAVGHTVERSTGAGAVLVVMEDMPKNAQSAGITGMAHGVVRLALVQLGIPHVRVAPSTLKAYSTGSGSAQKADMRMELYQRTGIDERSEDKVDAWWLRQAGLDAIGHPDAIKLPKHQRKRLQVVRWPKGVPLEI